MKLIRHKVSASLIGLLAVFLMGDAVHAQTGEITPSSSPTPAPISGSSPSVSATVATYQQKQMALIEQWQSLVSQGATLQQLQAWRQQNAARFQAQAQAAQALAAASALQPLAVISGSNMPTNASGALCASIMTQRALVKAWAQIHNQLAQTISANATVAQVAALESQAQQEFQEQNSGTLELHQQQVQAIAAQATPQPIPAITPEIPAGATPQLRAYLTARNALAASWAQTVNQNLTADSATRQVAMQQWRQENASQIRQLQQLGQALSAPTTLPQEENQ